MHLFCLIISFGKLQRESKQSNYSPLLPFHPPPKRKARLVYLHHTPKNTELPMCWLWTLSFFLIFTKKGYLPVLIYTVLFTCFFPDFPTLHALSHFSMLVVLLSFNLRKLESIKLLVWGYGANLRGASIWTLDPDPKTKLSLFLPPNVVAQDFQNPQIKLDLKKNNLGMKISISMRKESCRQNPMLSPVHRFTVHGARGPGLVRQVSS